MAGHYLYTSVEHSLIFSHQEQTLVVCPPVTTLVTSSSTNHVHVNSVRRTLLATVYRYRVNLYFEYSVNLVWMILHWVQVFHSRPNVIIIVNVLKSSIFPQQFMESTTYNVHVVHGFRQPTINIESFTTSNRHNLTSAARSCR